MAKKKIGFSPEEHSSIGPQLESMKNKLADMPMPEHYRRDTRVRKSWNSVIQAIQTLQSALDTDAWKNHKDEYDGSWYTGGTDYGNNL